MKRKTALISFVGTNDRGNDPKKGEGAILAVFDKPKYDKVYLLWVNTKKQQIDFREIAENVRHKLQGRKLCKDVEVIQFECKNVVDHNEIYQGLLNLCSEFPKEYNYTAAISSGTPQMQACWLLLAESGDFPIKLIRTNEKIFGGKRVEPVQLNSTLPRIDGLRNKVEQCEKEIQELTPNLKIDLKTGIVRVGDVIIKLAPVEYSHYCVLAKHALNVDEPYRFTESDIPQEMVIEAVSYYKRSFEQLYNNLTKKEQEEKESKPIEVKTWRSYISRINTAFKNSQLNNNIIKHYQVSIDGKRNSSLYYIKAHPKKIKFNS